MGGAPGQSPSACLQQGLPATTCTAPVTASPPPRAARSVFRHTRVFGWALLPCDLPLCSCSGPRGPGAGRAGQHHLPVGAGKEDHRHLLAIRRWRSAPPGRWIPPSRLPSITYSLSMPLLVTLDKASGGTLEPSKGK